MKRYIGFTEASTAALRDFLPIATPHIPRIVDDFYRTMEEHPRARAVLVGGAAQISALKGTLTRWLETLLAGPHDQGYFENRARIGGAHVGLELPQDCVCAGMSRIRGRLSEVVESEDIRPVELQRRMATAVQQILDIDLAIILESYREDMVARHRNAERLATIGQLAAGIGHEIRNPLAIIESSVYLLRQHLAATLAVHRGAARHLERIATEVKRSTNTINDLLTLAHQRPPRRARLPVRPLVAAATEAALLPPAVAVAIDVSPDLIGDFDGEQMRHVLANLLTNAAQAVQGAGEVRVSARAEGANLEIRVHDDGPGVPESVRERLFEPLFTTKSQGSGLGLALCRHILEAHGGTIELESGGPGATFVVRLPSSRWRPV